MCAHVENRFFLESLSLIDCCIQECCFYLWDFSSKLYGRVGRICLLNEICFSFSFASHKQNTSSMNLFHVSGFLTLCLKISFSIDAIKMLAKATAILVPMAVPCVWRSLDRAVKLEGVLLQYKAKHFSEEICSYRRVVGMNVLVCVAYYSGSFLLWYIREKASDIHWD